jgi:hypothetical protein
MRCALVQAARNQTSQTGLKCVAPSFSVPPNEGARPRALNLLGAFRCLASTEIKRLEFELEKARNGLAMPYDRERANPRGAREGADSQGQADGGHPPAEAKQAASTGRVARKTPAGGSRPGRAVWIVRVGRESDAGSLGRVCYRAVNGRIRGDPGAGGARVSIHRMGSHGAHTSATLARF